MGQSKTCPYSISSQDTWWSCQPSLGTCRSTKLSPQPVVKRRKCPEHLPVPVPPYTCTYMHGCMHLYSSTYMYNIPVHVWPIQVKGDTSITHLIQNDSCFVLHGRIGNTSHKHFNFHVTNRNWWRTALRVLNNFLCKVAYTMKVVRPFENHVLQLEPWNINLFKLHRIGL